MVVAVSIPNFLPSQLVVDAWVLVWKFNVENLSAQVSDIPFEDLAEGIENLEFWERGVI
jgi:hypothetical protein